MLLTTLALSTLVGGDSTRSFRIVLAPAESLTVTESGAGEPVVLVPGLFGSAFGYRKLSATLADHGYRTIVIEPLGIGWSSRPSRGNYSLSAQTDRIAAALDTIGLTKALIVGHSLGGAIALRLAYRRPDLVRGVVSIEGGPAESATTPSFRSDTRFIPWIKWFGGIKRVRKIMHEMLIDASGDTTWVSDDVVLGYTEGTARNLDATLLAYLAMARAKEPGKLRPHLPEVRCPVLLVLGDAPHAGAPPDAEVSVLVEQVGSFSVDHVAGAGHYIHEERPDAILTAIEHIRRTLAAGMR